MSGHGDLAFLGVAELSARIRTGALSPVRLAEQVLKRIEDLGARLGCFVTVTGDLMLAQAREAEAEIRAGRWRGPLHGIPYGVKDLLDTKGVRTTWGALPFANRVPAQDATVVRRLHAAGAVLAGKLAMSELAGALGCTSAHSSISGPCHNPWDESRFTGGSSSGPAAAVAAGLVPFSIASETLASMTTPAAFCGVTALRPTYGVVSVRGAMRYAYTLDTLGPIARDAADCALVLGAISGPDPLDATPAAPPPGLAGGHGERVAGLRLGVLGMPGAPPVSDMARQCYDRALSVLTAAGLVLEPISLPALPYGDVCAVLATAESYSAFEDFLRQGGFRQLSDRSHEGRAPEEYVPGASSADYVKAMRVRTQVQQGLARIFERFDLIVSPNTPYAPPAIDQPFADSPSATDVLEGGDNLAGLPALALPIGFGGPGRLPLGMQLIGQPFDEARLVAVAAAYQSRTRWHLERPPIS